VYTLALNVISTAIVENSVQSFNRVGPLLEYLFRSHLYLMRRREGKEEGGRRRKKEKEGERRRKGEKERRGEGEKGRRGEGEKGRRGEGENGEREKKGNLIQVSMSVAVGSVELSSSPLSLQYGT
jgi:hypothetical protein